MSNRVETLYFRDNKRIIDYVLVYKDDETEEAKERRSMFEANLQEEGLELETADKTVNQVYFQLKCVHQ